MKINIAIDGPSAAGKSTIAKILAKELQYSHLDTGAMYRCVAYYAREQHIDANDEKALAAMIDHMHITFQPNGDIFINTQNVSKEIRENNISMLASTVSIHPMVREKLVAMQQDIAKDKGYIMDGRDIGTVVLKDAEVKIFMSARVDARAARRFKEYQEKHRAEDYDTIFTDITKRDYQDMHRKTSPLKKAEDAIEIDTSDMSIEEVVCNLRNLIRSKL